MIVDKFTKIVLTVIAVNLSLLTVTQLELFPKVYANSMPNTETLLPQKNRLQYGLVPLNEDGSITVKLSENSLVDVNIKDINTYDELHVELTGVDTNEVLNVNLDEVGDGSINFRGPIPVKIEN